MDGKQIPCWRKPDGLIVSVVPDYSGTDCRAMRGALDQLSDEQLIGYGMNLSGILIWVKKKTKQKFYTFHSPLEYQAEAFIQTIQNSAKRNS